MNDHDTADLIRASLPAGQIEMISKLLAIRKDDSLSDIARQKWVLMTVLDFLSSIPILNADGKPLAPLYAVLAEIDGPLVSGGRDARHHALRAGGIAIVSIMRKGGTTANEAYEYVAEVCSHAGWQISARGVRGWCVGKIPEDIRKRADFYRSHFLQHVPLLIAEDLSDSCKAQAAYEDLANTFSRPT